MFSPRRSGCYHFNPQWEKDFLFIQCPAGALCLVCGSMVTSIKKFNVERHYKTTHSKEYGHITGDDRVNLVNMLKEDIANPTKIVAEENGVTTDLSLDTSLQPVPSTSHALNIADVLSVPNGAKKPKLIPKTEPIDFIQEASVNSQFPNLSYQLPEEDEYNIIGKRFAYQLKAMSEEQRILAEKIISDVMYYGRVGKLTENCFQHFPAT